jgi:beta-lactamase superfamily II metal-dependent hydrolase
VHVIDVGQGDAVLVISPDGFVMLVDSGEESQAQTVADYLTTQGITGIDYTLVSHMHTDHLGGMDILMNWYPDVVVSFDHGGAATSGEFDEYVAAAGMRRTTLLTGQAIDLGAGVQADVLHGHEGASLENNNSLVLRLTYGGNTFLLGGDCQSGCESDLVTGPIQIYKVHHHGSADASTDGLLTQMQPELALISVGQGNPYNHPDPNTVNRLVGYGADVHRTDLEGHLAVYADGIGYSLNAPPGCQTGQTRPCGSSDVGACEIGLQTCSGGTWGACEGAIEPVAEDCGNGIDDDCDGATDQADPDCGAPAGHVVIAQVGYDTPGTDEIEEFVDLFNPTSVAVAVGDWTLSDNLGSWPIPAGTTIQAGAYLSIARNGAGFEALYGLQPDVAGLTLALGNTGDVLVLSDAGGLEQDHVAWEDFEPGWSIAAAIGDSIERIDPGVDSDGPADWQATSPASPRGGVAGGTYCGDGVCDPGEDCIGCSADCVGRTGGKPTDRFCCGNGTCEPVGEDAANCPLDCN